MTDITAYQSISRNNDSNGNPYRLIILYGLNGKVIMVIECRDSMPNCENLFYDIPKLPSFHLSPKEYKSTKTSFSKMLATEGDFMSAVMTGYTLMNLSKSL
jgi:hypothetical protein